jgi:uncharacterized membrane protein YfcA
VTVEVVVTVAAGLAAGVLSGLFGVGGGILFVPALVLIADLGQVDAAATSLAAMVPVVLVGSWRQHLYGNVRWRAAVAIGVASIGGAFAGASIAEALPEDTLRKLFAVLLLFAAGHLVWSAKGRAKGG